MPVRVASAEEAAALDAGAIASGIPSRALMRVAAANAASVIARRCAERLAHGVIVYTGPGNNGGDGWAVARALNAAGVSVTVHEIVESRTPDAKAEREAAATLSATHDPDDGRSREGAVVIDALLGTGSAGAPRGAIAEAVRVINARRDGGALVVALDVPTGLGADGSADVVRADLTISFGTAKRETLIARERCGEIVVVDIGLGGDGAELPLLADVLLAHVHTPHIGADAHKGTRGSVAIVAGAERMGGAAILAATGALRAGVGLVKVVTARANIPSVHAHLPAALTGDLADPMAAIRDFADAVLIGPGLGKGPDVRALVEGVLREWQGPVVVDADALNAFDGDLQALAQLLRGRPALITPHPAELARLVRCTTKDVLARRFDIGMEVAVKLGATVLLKGTPTVVSGFAQRMVVARGTPALATGGSGDALGGIVATLLAQSANAFDAAVAGAWVHGVAAELTHGIRGVTLDDVLAKLPDAWRMVEACVLPQYPVLAELPAVA